jgi:hypothetical protein
MPLDAARLVWLLAVRCGAQQKENTMKNMLGLAGVVIGLVLCTAGAQEVEPGFKSLFNGKDLAGWAGRTNHWSVQDGAITGQTTKENPAQGNNFLIARDGDKDLVVGDFELRLSFRFGTNAWGNSGIQYRSKAFENYIVRGYQADMETGPTHTGGLYEEGGRGILCKRGDKIIVRENPAKPNKGAVEIVGSCGDSKAIQATIKAGDWNDIAIIAKGNHLQQFINGQQTVDVVDEQASKAAKSGVLALQIHAGQPMKIQFKNIRIKTLD